MVAVVHAFHADEALASLDELLFDAFRVFMVFQGVSCKTGDFAWAFESFNVTFKVAETELLAVIFEILAFDAVPVPTHKTALFIRIIYTEGTRFVSGAISRCKSDCIGFEEGPDQVKGDVSSFEHRIESTLRFGVVFIKITEQELALGYHSLRSLLRLAFLLCFDFCFQSFLGIRTKLFEVQK